MPGGRTRRAVFLAGLNCFTLLFFAGTSAGVETITADFAVITGSANRPIATGWLGALNDSIPDSLVVPLKPAYIRDVAPPDTHSPGHPRQRIWDVAESVGKMTGDMTLIVPVGDRWDWTHYPSIEYCGWDPFWKDSTDCEGKTREEVIQIRESMMRQWTDHVHVWVAWAESMKVANGRQHVLLQYNLFNEPDTWNTIGPCPNPDHNCGCTMGWHPAGCWGDSDSLFFEVWEATVDSIHAWVPGAVIEGPDFAFSVRGKAPSLAGASGLTMETFLRFCDDHHCLPDILAWHDIGNSDPTDRDMGAEEHFVGAGADSAWNLYTQVYYASTLDSVYQLSQPISRFEINEMMDRPMSLVPGIMVREFALAERAKALGLVFAGRSYWCETCENCTLGGPGSEEGRLAGLIQPLPDGSCDSTNSQYRGKRYIWWTQKAYADMNGRWVQVSSADSLDGLAAMSEKGDEARILLGRYLGAPNQDVHLVLKHLSSSLVLNEAIQVSVTQMPYAQVPQALPGLAPLPVRDGRVPVHADSVVVTIPANQFKAGGAISVVVRAPLS